jgi:hypothetical protein
MPHAYCHSSQSDIIIYLSASRTYIYTRRGCKCHPPCITKFICVLASGKSYTRRCSYMCVCSHINNERDDARSPIPFTHSTKHNAAHKSQAQRARARNNDSALSRVILRGLDSPFLSADVYVFPYFIDVQRRSAGVLCIN